MIIASVGVIAVIIGGLLVPITRDAWPATIGMLTLLVCLIIAFFIPVPESVYLVDKVKTEHISPLDDDKYYEIVEQDDSKLIKYAVNVSGTGRVLTSIETEKVHVNETSGYPYLVINRREYAPFIRLFFLCGEMPFYPKLNAGVKSVEIYVP